MGKATLFGKITAGIKVRLSKIIWMAKDLITGPMALSMRDHLKMVSCRAMANKFVSIQMAQYRARTKVTF